MEHEIYVAPEPVVSVTEPESEPEVLIAAVLTNDDVRRYAEVGARVRLHELAAERAAILRTFPNLNGDQITGSAVRTTGVAREGKAAWTETREKTVVRRRYGKRTRKGKTAAERAAISRRMKAYWRSRRKDA